MVTAGIKKTRFFSSRNESETEIEPASYVSADEIVPVFNDSPGCDPDSANFL